MATRNSEPRLSSWRGARQPETLNPKREISPLQPEIRNPPVPTRNQKSEINPFQPEKSEIRNQPVPTRNQKSEISQFPPENLEPKPVPTRKLRTFAPSLRHSGGSSFAFSAKFFDIRWHNLANLNKSAPSALPRPSALAAARNCSKKWSKPKSSGPCGSTNTLRTAVYARVVRLPIMSKRA